MDHLTEDQNRQLEKAIIDINSAAESSFPDVNSAGGFGSLAAHKLKLALDEWVNVEVREDWLLGEVVRAF